MQRKLFLLVATFIMAALTIGLISAQDDETTNLTILHTNDTHANHQANRDGDGGAARMAAVVNQIRAQVDNTILLDGGDRFTGTLFHTLYEGQDQVEVMNLLGYDAMALGNHEFDNGDEVLADFVTGLDFPALAANIDFSESPTLAEIGIEEYAIVDVNGIEVGVIGLTTPDTPEISNPGDELVFSDDLVTIANALAADLTDQGVNIIVLLTHTGINTDFVISPQLENIDVFVGGHSHSLFSNQYAGAVDEYPVVFTNEETGDTVLYVQAASGAQYLGRLDVEFDADGVATDWEGDTIFLSSYITPDPEMQALVDELAGPVEELRNEPSGASSDVELVGDRTVCRVQECNLGNLIADAMLWETGADIAIMNSGGIRRDLPAADLTIGDLLELQPFGNTVATMEITGADLIAALENGVSRLELNDAGQVSRDGASGRFPQVSGFRFRFDPTLEAGSRIVFVEIQQADGSYVPVEEDAVYLLATANFVAGGGDGYSVLAENGQNTYLFGRLDWEVTRDYMVLISPIGMGDDIEVDADAPRIEIINAEVAPPN